MKNKNIPPSFFALLVLLALALVSAVIASDFSGPEKLGLPNVHQPRSDWNFIVWNQDAGREWLRIAGDSMAKDLSEQWRPDAVTIETTREPILSRTSTGWKISFK